MAPELNVYALPKLIDPDTLVGGTAVVIDVLRSTTTIAFALESGAVRVYPCREIEEARAMADKLPRNEILLGGERNGTLIEGFDLGNSPEEYITDDIRGKKIIFTTTNGTATMALARAANRVFLAAFVNASAIVKKLIGCEQIHIICSGTDGEFSQDDILLAGMLVERLEKVGGLTYLLNAQAMTAKEVWLQSFPLPCAIGAEPILPGRMEEELRKTLGAKNLIALGLDDDILAASQIDKFTGAPELDVEDFYVRLS